MERRNIEICPYWRRWAIGGDHILVLCGKKLPNEELPPDTDLGFRQTECPIFGKLGTDNAFRYPQIMEFFWDEDGLCGLPTMIIKPPSVVGGVDYLEQIWNREVEKFVERHP